MSNNFLDYLSTHFMFCNEKIENNGEDSGYEAYTSEAGIMGVFDGCGGLGAKSCSKLSGKTEAYLASRTIANAVRLWFLDSENNNYQFDITSLRDLLLKNLKICEKFSSEESSSCFIGSLVRSLPSTLAVVTMKGDKNGLEMEHIWAGDSRTFIFDSNGIGQVSADDTLSEDAMSNLIQDGVLKNVISSDGKFEIHHLHREINAKCIVLCATDGCFQYLPSPMHFEKVILGTMILAKNVDEWKKTLCENINEVAGDDQTLTVAAFGFDSFENMKKYYKTRFEKVKEITDAFEASDDESGILLWKKYKKDYYRFSDRKE